MAARGWLGTPYRHQASKRGIGADCLGLVRGVWRECIGPEPQRIPAYSQNWSDPRGDDALLQAMQNHFRERMVSSAQPGDVLLFRMQTGCPAKHCAILSEPARIIHAYWGRAVTETHLVPWWQRRCVAAFSFPQSKE